MLVEILELIVLVVPPQKHAMEEIMNYNEVHTRLVYKKYPTSLVLKYLILLLIICLINCSEKDSKSNINDLRTIPTELNIPAFDIGEYIQEVEYTYLQSDHAFLTIVKDLVITDDFFIITSFNRAAVYFFNKDGSLHHKIIGSGDGPLEFNSVADISLGSKPNQLYIADKNNFKILEYNYLDNEFIEEHSFSYPIYSLFNFENYIYILTNTYDSGIIKSINPINWQVVNEYIKEPTIANRVITPEPFYKSDKDLYVGINLSDTIYKVEAGSLTPYFILGNNIFPSLSESGLVYGDFLNEFLTQSYSEYSLNLNLTMLSQGKIGDIFTIPIFSFAEDPRTVFYDQKNLTSIKIPSNSIKNLNLFFKFYFQILDSEKNNLYTSFVLHENFYKEAAQYVKENGNSISKELKQFLELYPQEKELENPVIVRIKFKPTFQNVVLDLINK